ncbi:MAG: glycosyltransferase family 1 protein [Dehalococcoidia bacterium]
MRIAIDATSVPTRPAGSGVYAIELVRALAGRDDRRDGYAVFTRGSWFDDAVAGRKNWRIERVAAGSRSARLLWEQARLPVALRSLGIDVLHSTHHTLPVLPVRTKRVVTVHDVTFFRLPERYTPARRLYMQTLTRTASRAADAIIVPSQTVRDDAIAALGIPASRVHVVYEAAAAQYRPLDRDDAETVAHRYGLDAPYILSVGSIEPGKNRARLIRAMRALRDEGIDHTLAVVGQKAWHYEEEFALVRDLGMRDRVVYLDYVRAGDLPALYNAAAVFAFPSLYEGFGLPVLEAMACGVPVLTSNLSATAEIAGDAALLVDPTSVEQIREGLRQLLTTAILRHDLRRRGLERAAQFSWARAADETHAVYEHVARDTKT